MSRRFLGSQYETSMTEIKATLSVDTVNVEFNLNGLPNKQSIYLVFVARMEELWN
jgi:hypothetical protein